MHPRINPLLLRGEPLAVRFDNQVDRLGPDDCWLWSGRQKNSYGRIVDKGRGLYAHRVALSLHLGRELLDTEDALHSCDTPLCCNPAHLRVGTHLDNMRDMRDRGRSPRGEEHHNSKLTAEQVKEIRALYATGDYSTRALAKRFGIARSATHRIVKGEMWRAA